MSPQRTDAARRNRSQTSNDLPILLLTAAIDPRSTVFVMRRDPVSRFVDYQEALKWWLAEKSIQRIIFCENSGSSLDELVATVRENNKKVKDVRFIGRTPADHEASRGKGYGELSIIRHVIAASQLTDSDRLMKVTGRYYTENIESIRADAIKYKTAALVSCALHNDARISSECFIATVGFLRRYLIPRLESIDDTRGVYFEHALAQSIKQAIGDGARHAVFNIPPRIVGISGTTNLPWGTAIDTNGIRIFLTPDYCRFFNSVLAAGSACVTSQHEQRTARRLCKRLSRRAAMGSGQVKLSHGELLTLSVCINRCMDASRPERCFVNTGFPVESAKLLAKAFSNVCNRT